MGESDYWYIVASEGAPLLCYSLAYIYMYMYVYIASFVLDLDKNYIYIYSVWPVITPHKCDAYKVSEGICITFSPFLLHVHLPHPHT